MNGYLVLAMLAIAASATADIIWTPGSPVLGQAVGYTAVDDNTKPVQSYMWEYRFISGSCAGNWITAAGNQSTIVFEERFPGTWEMRLTATYAPGPPMGMPPMPPPPPPPTVITKNVTIAPPTTFSITSGLSTPTPLAGSDVVKFKLKAGSTDCGPYLDGMLAQERITGKTLLSPPLFPLHPADDVDWSPNSADPAFHLVGNQIEDTKAMNGWQPTDPDWMAIPNGAIFYTVEQHLRLKYVDPCGDTKYIDLGSVILERVKVDAGRWEVIEGP